MGITVLLLLLLTVSTFGQTALPITFTFQDGARDSAQLFIIASASPITTVALASPITIGATTITLTLPASVPNGSGIVIDNESMMVTSTNGVTHTVTRGRLGTTATTHAALAVVKLQKYPTLVSLVRGIMMDAIAQIMEQYPPSNIITEKAKITAALTAIDAIKVGAVQ